MLRTYVFIMYAAGCIATHATHVFHVRPRGVLRRRIILYTLRYGTDLERNASHWKVKEKRQFGNLWDGDAKTTGPDWPIKTEKRSLGRVFVPGATCMRNPCSLATPLFFSFCCAPICMSACHPPGCLLAPAARLLNCVCVCVCVVHQTHLPTHHSAKQPELPELPTLAGHQGV